MFHAKGIAMNDLDFAALLVSRVCHDLVTRWAQWSTASKCWKTNRHGDARRCGRLVAERRAGHPAASVRPHRLRGCRLGRRQLDLSEVGRIMAGCFGAEKELVWQNMRSIGWDWAKLLMNTVLVAASVCPRGRVTVRKRAEKRHPSRSPLRAMWRASSDAEHALLGEANGALDGRSIQPYLTHQLAKGLNARLSAVSGEGEVRFAAG